MDDTMTSNQQEVFLDKLVDDLKEAKSPSTPSLYIEIEKRHSDLFANNKVFAEGVTSVCKRIYDAELTADSNKTNVILIESNDNSPINLIESIIDLLDSDIQKSLNENLSQTVIQNGITYSLKTISGGLSELLPPEFFADSILDIFKSGFKEVTDYTKGLVNIHDELIDASVQRYTKKLVKGADISDEIYISEKAQEVLKKVVLSIHKADQEEAEAVKNFLELILALGINSPKLILIPQPERLDKVSICFLLFLLGYEKKLIEESIGSTTGISFCLTFTDEAFQPNAQDNSQSKPTLRLIKELHIFAQRYQLLEIPDNNRPKQAVANSTFVARSPELSMLKKRLEEFNSSTFESSNERSAHFSELILGESGAGKTSLIQKHILQTFTPLPDLKIKDKQKNPIHLYLSLFNTNSFGSRSDGLASLKQSIELQSRKLNDVLNTSKGQRFKQHVKSKLKGLGLITTIGSAFDLSSEIVNILDAVNTRQNKNDKLKELSHLNKASTDEASRAPVLQLFENIDKALFLLISAAKAMYGKEIKITLFIDDIQWLDDISARYIVEHLLKMNAPSNWKNSQLQAIRLLVTGRSGDLEHRVTKALKEKESHFLNFLNAVHTGLSQDLKTKIHAYFEENTTLDSLVNKQVNSQGYHLNGFNLEDTNALVDAAIQANAEQKLMLSKQLNLHLGRNGIINTMHLVESINMLCDPLFYKQDKFWVSTIEPIIDFSGRRPEIIVDTDSLQLHIEKIFLILKETYSASFNAFSSEGLAKDISFNVSALAVLEERLLLVQSHVGAQYSTVCKHSLLIANLLSEPFNKEIIEYSMSSIARSNIEDYPNLSLMRDLFGNFDTYLDNTHYDVLDAIYNIISQMEDLFTRDSNNYQISHSLWTLFLTSHFENWLKAHTQQNSNNSALVINDLCRCLIDAISRSNEVPTISDYKKIGMIVSLCSYAYSHVPDYWAYLYVAYLVQQASLYRENYDSKSIEILNQAIKVINIELNKKISATYQNDLLKTKKGVLQNLTNTYSYFDYIDLADKAKLEYELLSNKPSSFSEYERELAQRYEKLKTLGAKALTDENGLLVLDVFNPIAEYEDKLYEALQQQDFDNEAHYELVSENLSAPLELEDAKMLDLDRYYYSSRYLARSHVYHGDIEAGLTVYLDFIVQFSSMHNNAKILDFLVYFYESAAELYFDKLHQKSKAIMCLQEAVKLIEESDAYENLSTLKRLYKTLLLLGYYQFQDNLFDLALNNYSLAGEIISTNKGAFDENNLDLFKALNGKAQSLIKLEKYTEATLSLEEALHYLESKQGAEPSELNSKKLITFKSLYFVCINNNKVKNATSYAYSYFNLLLCGENEPCFNCIDDFTDIILDLLQKFVHQRNERQIMALFQYLLKLSRHSFTRQNEYDLNGNMHYFDYLASAYENEIDKFLSRLTDLSFASDQLSEEHHHLHNELQFTSFVTQNVYNLMSRLLIEEEVVIENIQFYLSIQEKEFSLLEKLGQVSSSIELKLNKYETSSIIDLKRDENEDIAFKYFNQCKTAFLFPEVSISERNALRFESTKILDELHNKGFIDTVHFKMLQSEIGIH